MAEPDVAAKVFKLVDAVDDLDDVQNVFVNADIPELVHNQRKTPLCAVFV